MSYLSRFGCFIECCGRNAEEQELVEIDVLPVIGSFSEVSAKLNRELSKDTMARGLHVASGNDFYKDAARATREVGEELVKDTDATCFSKDADPTEDADVSGVEWIRFVDLGVLEKQPRLPRRGSTETFVHPLTGERNLNLCREVSTFDRDRTCFVFVSHKWLSPAKNDHALARPDDMANAKFDLIINACAALRSAVVPENFTVAVWVDYCCIDQDNVPVADLLNLHVVISMCDLILTPVVDSEFESWSFPDKWNNCFEEYQAKEWHAYWTRAWCRMEAMFAATLPLPDAGERARLFRQGALRDALSLDRRPHVIFGTKELHEQRGPLFLPPLIYDVLEQYDPEKGTLTNAEDSDIIARLANKARSHIMDSGETYTGPTNAAGEPHGYGKKKMASGKVYEGEFVNGKQTGRGTCKYAHWDVYEGEWLDNKRHGKGRHMYANGDLYEGEWEFGKKHGHGKFIFASGEIYEGTYRNGVPSDIYEEDSHLNGGEDAGHLIMRRRSSRDSGESNNLMQRTITTTDLNEKNKQIQKTITRTETDAEKQPRRLFSWGRRG